MSRAETISLFLSGTPDWSVWYFILTRNVRKIVIFEQIVNHKWKSIRSPLPFHLSLFSPDYRSSFSNLSLVPILYFMYNSGSYLFLESILHINNKNYVNKYWINGYCNVIFYNNPTSIIHHISQNFIFELTNRRRKVKSKS